MVEPDSTVAKIKAKRIRSPAYPGINLEEALSKAEAIRKAEGKNEANIDTILAHWGYAPKSGAGWVALSALLKFGLLSDSGSGDNRKARLTDIAFKILLDDRPDSTERPALVKEAALAPAIHRELWDKYNGALPSDLNIRHFLRSEKGFQDGAANDLIREFRDTIAFAKLDESDNMSGQSGDKPTIEVEKPIILSSYPPPSKAEPTKQNAGQTMRQIQIPLTGAPWATILLPVPMSEDNWDEMLVFLNLMKAPITHIQNQPDSGKTNV